MNVSAVLSRREGWGQQGQNDLLRPWWCFSASQHFHQSDRSPARGREAFVGTGAASSRASSHLRSPHVTSFGHVRGRGGLCVYTGIFLFSLDCVREQISFRNFPEFEWTSPSLGPEYPSPIVYHICCVWQPTDLWNDTEDVPARLRDESSEDGHGITSCTPPLVPTGF